MGKDRMLCYELRAEILPDGRVWSDLYFFAGLVRCAFLDTGSHFGDDLAYSLVDKPAPRFVTVDATKLLHQLEHAATLAGRVAVPATVIQMEGGSSFFWIERTLAPPIMFTRLLLISLDLQYFEEATPIGVLADLSQVITG